MCHGRADTIRLPERTPSEKGNQVQVTTGLEGELAKEYSKEFLCEGQLWFYYKRTNTAKIQSGSSNTNITMSNAKYVPNLPDSEIKYRN